MVIGSALGHHDGRNLQADLLHQGAGLDEERWGPRWSCAEDHISWLADEGDEIGCRLNGVQIEGSRPTRNECHVGNLHGLSSGGIGMRRCVYDGDVGAERRRLLDCLEQTGRRRGDDLRVRALRQSLQAAAVACGSVSMRQAT